MRMKSFCHVVIGVEFQWLEVGRRGAVDKIVPRQTDVEEKIEASTWPDNANVADPDTLHFVSTRPALGFWDPERVTNSPSEENASICI